MHFLLVPVFLYILVASACSPQVSKNWVVGLRQGHTLEKHLETVGRAIPIEQYIPHIHPANHGYAASIAEDDHELFQLIRGDPGVGFVVQKARGFFAPSDSSETEGLDEDGLEMYNWAREWDEMQMCDTNLVVTDWGAQKIPHEYKVTITAGYSRREHFEFVGQTLPFHDFFPGEESYWVKFADDEQEKALLPLIRKDPGVTRIFPNRKSDSGRAPVEPILRIGAHQEL